MKKIVLFDMDDTLCDYRGKILMDVNKQIGTKNIEEIDPFNNQLSPEIRGAIKEIRRGGDWWNNIPIIQSGLALWHYFGLLGIERHILTKAPFGKEDSNGWAEKFEWYKKFLPEAKNFTETLDKEYVFGDIIVDDWTPYIIPWLNRWKTSVAIIPELDYNREFKHERAIHYSGRNFKDIEKFLKEREIL